MSETLPTSFNELKPTELYRAAIEDFALPVDEADKNKKTVLLAAFVEGGVTWDDYVAQHPEFAPAPAPNVVVAPPVDDGALRAESAQPVDPAQKWDNPAENAREAAVAAGRIVTAERPVYNPLDKLLIKMERDNPLFEIRGHKFTTKNPYALMSPADAEYAITQEDGFRQATPSELQEFYG